MHRRSRNSRRWNGAASPLKWRARELALGGVLLGIFVAFRAVAGSAPAPVEVSASAGLFLIVWALLPESDPDPAPSAPEARTEPMTLPDWLQIAFNIVVLVMVVSSVVLLEIDHRVGVRLFVVTVGVGVVCALVNHMHNGPPHASD